MTCVIDASMALAWCMGDEQDDRAERVLTELEETELVAPHLWLLEISNALLMAERRKRLTAEDVGEALGLLQAQGVAIDEAPHSSVWAKTLPLARRHGLSVYDAAYLELALRRQASLATLDTQLEKAARAEGVACR